ncbi:MAG TPA: glycine cleavage system protein H [Chloroflexi bacterium]|nr:glycine cleavage system protein H [Chloroflexota bacterium]
MKIDKYEYPDDLLYDREHNWARIEGNIVTQGFTDFAQSIAGEIVYVEIPRVGREVKQGEAFMSIESGKWVGRIKATFSGRIVEANEDLEWESTLVNEDPYGKGWMVKIEASNLEEERKNLYSPSDPEFQAFVQEEIKKYTK